MEVLHNSHLTMYRQPFGAVPVGGTVRLALDVWGEDTDAWHGEWITEAAVRIWRDGFGETLVPMQPLQLPSGGRRFAAKIEQTETAGLIWYYFLLRLSDGSLLFYGNNTEQLGGVGSLGREQPPSYQITVWQPLAAENRSSWFSNSICYQIFPDRFCRGDNWQDCQLCAKQPDGWRGPARFVQHNWYDKPFYTYNSKGEVTRWGFFGGNLEGIRSKLLYLKSLGVTSLYLNPIFQASSNHKYDTADYLRIDPSFGDEEDFKRLCAEAGQLGIRIILDGVFSHTGADSRYFNKFGNYADVGAFQSESSPYFDWYKFQEYPEKYTGWWGVTDLPEVQESNLSYQQFIYAAKNSVVRRWLRLGASGWRLDVADELPDSFIAGLAAAAKAEKPDALVLGEVWEDASNKQSYGEKRRYLFGEELDGVMNYPFRDAAQAFILGKLDAEDMAARFISQLENYPAYALVNNLNLIGTHDTARVLTVLGADLPQLDRNTPAGRLAAEEYELTPEQRQLGKQRLKLLSLLQFTMLGVPCVYYGDEAGCEGLPDPFNRGTYPWGREDEDLFYWYRRLANLRQEYRLLQEGEFWPLALADDVYACRRFWSAQAIKSGQIKEDAADFEEVLVVCNRNTEETVSVQLPLPMQGECAWGMELLSGRQVVDLAGQQSLLQSLPPLSAQVWLFRRQAPAQWRPERAAGVLCPISALPLTEGGWPAAARRFVDYLVMAGQKVWQLLPLNPVGESGSPYTPYSVFAGQEQLAAEVWELAECRVPPQDMAAYQAFCQEQADWLEDYALFAAISESPQGAGLDWQDWPQPERERENLAELKQTYADAMERCRGRQFMFWRAWQQLREYANGHGVRLIGDVPIYTGPSSADVWAHRELFLLRADGWPLAGAGVPPDYFSADGQNWGHSLYNWPQMQADGYQWWRRRMALALQAYDYIRLDHFRSFSAFFAIPANATPKEGSWLKGPGHEFFAVLEQNLGLGKLPIIAEDLGLLDQEVYNLLQICGYPGMLVYQFSPGRVPTQPEEPAEDLSNRVLYSGTHDNQTLCGWLHTSGEEEPEARAREIMRLLYQSPAPLVIMPLQDIFGLGDEARLNIPGQALGNWRWQADWQQFKITLAAELAALVKATNR